MRYYVVLITFLIFFSGYSQKLTGNSSFDLSKRVSTIEFVEIVDNHLEEALYYYKNNWKVLRQKAIENDYILSYQLLQAPATEDSAIQLILITTYANSEQYDKREENFAVLIKERGDLRLLNNKKPGEFRKRVLGKELVKHLY
ncbi:MAG: hypothetical protein QNJ57_11000 [Flavobacteriaceae bacterium]|nr:hypothetical protein [Flavobacteriaceae bacterium]